MKKKIAGKVGAFLMAATMTFSGTAVAFADETTDTQAAYSNEAIVEQNEDETLDTASSGVLESGTGYKIEKAGGYSSKNHLTKITIDADKTSKDLNTLISELVDKKSVGEKSEISINNIKDNVIISKSNIEKIKNKSMSLLTGTWHVGEDEYVDQIKYYLKDITNTSSDFPVNMSINADSAAISKIKSAGISRYLTFTTDGKAGSLLPGKAIITFCKESYNDPDFDFPQQFSLTNGVLNQELNIGYDLFVYYYNASTGRFIEHGVDETGTGGGIKASLGAHGLASDTTASVWACNFHGTYVVTQGKLPSSLLMDYYTGLVNENGNWLYYKNGAADASYTGLCQYNGAWWYVKNGKVDFSASGLCKYNSAWWYVYGGKVNFSATGLCKYNGSWWYVRNGKVDFSSTTLCRYNGSWWYVSGGRVNFGAAGLCKYNGAWWYVSGGKVNFNATGLCKYNGSWWYVNNGKVSFTTTLCKYNGTWWYIENGKINFNKTTLVKYGNNWYAVAGGKVAWNYSGKLNYNGGTFKVVKGIVKF